MDTGSEVTLILGSLIQDLPKRRIVSQIHAANGTLIEVLGEVDRAVGGPTKVDGVISGVCPGFLPR